jgi:Iap family predicted aminopeptidase
LSEIEKENTFGAEHLPISVPAAGYDALEGTLIRTDKFSPWDRPAPAEGPFRCAADGGYALAVARRLTGYRNNGQGFRMAGSAANRQAALYLHDEMTKIGIPAVTLEEFPVYGWSFREASLSVEDTLFSAIPYVSTPSTDPEGIDAPLVYVGNGTSACYQGLSVRDKIVLIGLDYRKLPWPSLAALQAEQFGAAAAVIFNLNTYGQGNSGTALTQQDWSNHAPSIPVINVSPNCGLTLAKAAASGRLPAKLRSLTEHDPAARACNVIGSIPGHFFPDEYIIMSAHYDSYFQGFQDDALGVGVAMAVLKGIQDSGYRPQRTLVLVLVDAEEFGVKGAWDDWLTGSWNLLKERQGWSGRTVAAINLELMAYRHSRTIGTRANDELVTFLGSYCAGYSIDPEAFADPEIDIYRGVTSWTDEWSYSYHGIPTIGTKSDPEMIERYYHTQFDTEALVCPRKVDEMPRFYGGLLIRLDSSLYHPYDLSVRAGEYTSALRLQDLSACGISADEAADEAASLAREARARLSRILAGEEEYRRLLEGAGKSSALSSLRRKAKAINEEHRSIIKEVMAETQYLGSAYPEAVVPRAVHYQHDYLALCRLENLLSAGRIREAGELIVHPEEGIQGLYYAREMTRELFRDHFILGFFREESCAPASWTSGRVLEYHDLWAAAMELLSEKPAAGSWQPLLDSLAAARARAKNNLRQALADDAALWRRVRQLVNAAAPVWPAE